jgi:ABC-2 type transport system ATP-binding protein
VTGFLGPNGAGKTTTLRALLGLVEPDSGSASFGGRRYGQLERPIETVGAVLERSGFHPGRSGRNHLRVLARAAGLPRSRADEVLGLLNLGEPSGKRVRGYSFGMRQRLALASALLGDPEVLILDEPANGLDPPAIRWLRDFLRAQAGAGRTVLISSHVLAEVAQTVTDVVVIDRGRLVADTTLADVTRRAGARVRVRSPDVDRLAAVLREQGYAAEPAEPGVALVANASSEAVGQLASDHRIVLHELVASSPSLEDVFMELTGRGPGGEREGATGP